MKEVITKVYQYEELNDEAKEIARQWYAEASAHDEWWESTYEDAERIGLKITAFDCDRGNSIHGDFTECPIAVCQAIIKEHGEACDTHKLAVTSLDALKEHSDKMDDTDDLDDEWEDMKDVFLRLIKEEYLHILRKELEYINSEEYITEAIKANEYEFTEDGARFVC